MNHSFNVNIAVKYGVHQAIILNNLYFWIEKNKANNKHYYDGKYWTYNSKKAFSELLPYMSERQIDYSLNKLIKDGLIIKGNYNKSKYDRTLWYAITSNGYSILQNCEIEKLELSNQFNDNVQPIPDINTNINNTDINTNNISKNEEKEFESINEYNELPKTSVSKVHGVDDDYTNALSTNNKRTNEKKFEKEFESIWEIYPNKKGKQKSLGYYINARKGGEKYEDIKKGVENYLLEIDIKRTQESYIKHGSTWFYNKCWLDDYQTVPNRNKVSRENDATRKYKTPEELEKLGILKNASFNDDEFDDIF